jgi:hypothetical protein
MIVIAMSLRSRRRGNLTLKCKQEIATGTPRPRNDT